VRKPAAPRGRISIDDCCSNLRPIHSYPSQTSGFPEGATTTTIRTFVASRWCPLRRSCPATTLHSCRAPTLWSRSSRTTQRASTSTATSACCGRTSSPPTVRRGSRPSLVRPMPSPVPSRFPLAWFAFRRATLVRDVAARPSIERLGCVTRITALVKHGAHVGLFERT